MQKDMHKDCQNRMENSKYPHTNKPNRVLTTVMKRLNGGKIIFSTNGAGTIVQATSTKNDNENFKKKRKTTTIRKEH
jgi:hypothetical protein